MWIHIFQTVVLNPGLDVLDTEIMTTKTNLDSTFGIPKIYYFIMRDKEI